jgi:hypothetical protein
MSEDDDGANERAVERKIDYGAEEEHMLSEGRRLLFGQ